MEILFFDLKLGENNENGKTTLMLQLMKHLNEEGKYIALYVNIEAAQPLRNKI